MVSDTRTTSSSVTDLLPTQKKQTRKFLVTTVIVVFIAAVFILSSAWRQGLFDSELSYKFSTPSGEGLSRGMSVRFKGFKIGYLDTLELRNDGHIAGEIIVKEKHAIFMKEGSALRVSKDKIVTSELVLEPGPAQAAVLGVGSELPIKRDGGMDAFEKRMMERIDPVLSQLTHLMQQLGDKEHGVPSAVEALRVSLVQANTTLIQVNTTLGTANKTFASLDQRIRDPHIDGILTHADETLAGLKSNTDQLNKTLQSSQQLMASGQQLLGTSQQTMQTLNKDLSDTLKQTQRVLGETVGLMEDFRGSTLGRWFVAPRKPASAPVSAP